MFPKMVDRIPESRVGCAAVEHFDVVRSFFALKEGVAEGRYARLKIRGKLWMSDTQMEHRTNYEVVRKATGDVLIAGLGLGMLLDPIIAKEDVRSITIIEREPDVIAMVAPHFPSDKITIIEADISTWKPVKGIKFDCIYFDIWADQSTDDIAEMATLHRRFARTLNRENPAAWMGSWRRDELLSRRRREQKEYRHY